MLKLLHYNSCKSIRKMALTVKEDKGNVCFSRWYVLKWTELCTSLSAKNRGSSLKRDPKAKLLHSHPCDTGPWVPQTNGRIQHLYHEVPGFLRKPISTGVTLPSCPAQGEPREEHLEARSTISAPCFSRLSQWCPSWSGTQKTESLMAWVCPSMQ